MFALSSTYYTTNSIEHFQTLEYVSKKGNAAETCIARMTACSPPEMRKAAIMWSNAAMGSCVVSIRARSNRALSSENRERSARVSGAAAMAETSAREICKWPSGTRVRHGNPGNRLQGFQEVESQIHRMAQKNEKAAEQSETDTLNSFISEESNSCFPSLSRKQRLLGFMGFLITGTFCLSMV
jgi:hypothetical protein